MDYGHKISKSINFSPYKQKIKMREMEDKMKIFYGIIPILIALSLNNIDAQINETKLVPADDTGLFGEAVSIDGDYAVMGTSWEDSLATAAGAVYVFKKSGTNWIQQAKLVASDGGWGDNFGLSVSISGNYFIAGAFKNEYGVWAGAAYIFQRDTITDEWVEQEKITASDGDVGDHFGISVSMEGDYALIGAQGDSGGIGSAYVFKWVDSTWTEQAKFSASNGVGGALFGNSVCLSGDYAIIGAPLDDGIGHESGAAYIFYKDGQTWTQQQRLLSSDMLADDRFGYSVSISGDYAIISAISGWTGPVTSTGAAYIFKRNGNTWTEQIKLVDSTAFTSIRFGNSVYIDGEYAVVGVPSDDDQGISSGSAFLYKREGENWFEIEKLLASDGGGGDNFGYSVCVKDDQIIVGSPFQSTGGSYDGAAYVYTNFFTGINENEDLTSIQNFTLEQNYPNPFNPETVISWQSAVSSNVNLTVYNIVGQRVAILINERKPAGIYSIKFNASTLPSGIYYYQLQAGDYQEVKKMILMK
jgi:hypothetical protein